MIGQDSKGRFAKGNSGKPKGTLHKKTVELDELRRKLLIAMDKSQDEFQKAFDFVLQTKPEAAIRLIQAMFPKDYRVSTDDAEFKIIIESIEKKKNDSSNSGD